MKMHITTAALVLAAAPAFSQSAMTGVSNPDPVAITSDDATAQGVTAKPSADVSATVPASPAVEYGPYFPYKGAAVAGSSVVMHETPAEDPADAMIVTSVPELQGTLREGTLLKV